jgi:hypothetical protein
MDSKQCLDCLYLLNEMDGQPGVYFCRRCDGQRLPIGEDTMQLFRDFRTLTDKAREKLTDTQLEGLFRHIAKDCDSELKTLAKIRSAKASRLALQ